MDSLSGIHQDKQTKPQCEDLRQQSRLEKDDFSLSRKPEVPFPIPTDSLEAFGSAVIQTLEDLLAKLEFENELNRVCGHQDSKIESHTHIPSTPAEGDRMDSLVEETCDVEDDDSRFGEHAVIQIVLQMEQEYDLSMYYDLLT